jgi:hypothetical protein
MPYKRLLSEFNDEGHDLGQQNEAKQNKKAKKKKNKDKKLTIREEINYYKLNCCQKKVSLEEYWHNKASHLPMLASLVREYCAIPATSVASESAFSIANFIQRKERSGLSEETLRSSIILRQKDLLEQICFENDA